MVTSMQAEAAEVINLVRGDDGAGGVGFSAVASLPVEDEGLSDGSVEVLVATCPVAAPPAKRKSESTGAEGKSPAKRKRGRPRKTPKKVLFLPIESSLTATPTKIYFEVAGKPEPKKRVAYGRSGHRYNPSKVAEQQFASAVARLCVDRLGSVPKFPAGSLLKVNVKFLFPRKQNQADAQIVQTADVDNLCKFILDALNGTLYDDDRQVVELSAKKGFDTSPNGHTIVTITKQEL